MAVNRSLDVSAADEARAETLAYYGVADTRYEQICRQTAWRHEAGHKAARIARDLHCPEATIDEILRRTG